MSFSVYDKQTGQILRSGSCQESDIRLQYNDATEGILHEQIRDDAFYVVNGAVVQMPAKTSNHHIFDYATKQWIDPRTLDSQWAVIRAKRVALLAASDWTQLPDVPQSTRSQWATYRQALRDITRQPDPFAILWPGAPS